MKVTNPLILLIILSSFGVGFYFYPQLPDVMASNWNAQGQVDGYISKTWGVFLMPIISFIVALLFLLIPKIDPLKENIAKFRKYFDGFIILILAFLFYIYLLTIIWNLGNTFNMTYVIIPALSVILYYAGVLIEKAKRNWFVGIRTPWTLSSEEVWDKTHKIGAKLFKISAFLALFGLLFGKYEYATLLAIIPVIFSSIFTIVYSYFIYQKLKHEKHI
ncbi:SdpI family protein [Patescibacteria group bacterium]